MQVPFAWLLPQCSLVIHHGGCGTVNDALHAAVPQVVCPFIFDQFFWAEKCSQLGVACPPVASTTLSPVVTHVDSMTAGVDSAAGTRSETNWARALRSGRAADGMNALEKCCQELEDACLFAVRPTVQACCRRVCSELWREDGATCAAKVRNRSSLFRSSGPCLRKLTTVFGCIRIRFCRPLWMPFATH